jgi:hypothetical protein
MEVEGDRMREEEIEGDRKREEERDVDIKGEEDIRGRKKERGGDRGR